MATQRINRVMIVGTNSGCGKTTITCAILKALMNKKLKVASFKCGPDYIDPMFHSEIIGTKSRNIDLFLCNEKTSKYLFAKNSEGCDISVIEGVMGFYDGIGGNTILNSSCDISNKFNIPAILVVNCKGASISVVAMIKGYIDFSENNIKAVILNNVSKHMYSFYKKMIEENLNIKVLGYIPNIPEAALESRHLGLITAKEVESLNEKIELLAKTVEETIDIDGIINISKDTAELEFDEINLEKIANVKIAVAKDNAFCFYYEDCLNLLKMLGAELIYFSPLEDKELPQNINGVILGGGYPELYLEKLSKNKTMLESIKSACENLMPIYAECGGYMYLGETIKSGNSLFPMVSAININCEMTNKLQNFGYITLTSKQDTMLLNNGEKVNAHEFHYSKSDKEFEVLNAEKSTGKSWNAGFSQKNIFAGYPHIHFWGNTELAKRFILKCEEFKNGVK